MVSVDMALSRVQDWLRHCKESDQALGERANVDPKTVRLARRPDWNPTAETLRRFETLLPPYTRAPRGRRAVRRSQP